MGSVPDGRHDPPGATGDLLSEAATELYGTDPEEFTDRRKVLSAAAKAAGDAAAAKQIAALRKPTRAAWVVNRLARADPAAPARLAALADALRAAEEAKDGPRLRELSAARGQLIDGLTGQALTAAGVADAPAGLRDEVTATLTAALADPEVAAAVAAGTLTRAAQWAGFGLPLPTTADDEEMGPWGIAEPSTTDRPVPLRQGRSMLEERRKGQGQSGDGAEQGKRRLAEAGSRQVAARTPATLGEGASERRTRLAQEKAELLVAQAAEEAAQAADRRRKIFEDAERAVAAATAAAADVLAAEDRLEGEVRDLEQRLTRARAELADIRLRARRAESTERKAREVLDRLPRPDDSV